MKKVQLTPSDIKRIELKFECIRRNTEYRKDYQNLQKTKERSKARYESLESFFYSKWFHFPLLNPDISIDDYRKKKNYDCWLERTLGGLISSDQLSPQPIKVDSRSIRSYLLWKRKGYKLLIGGKKATKMIQFPKGDKIYDKLDRQEIERGLRNLKITVDLKGFTKEELKEQFVSLLDELKTLKVRFLGVKGSIPIRPGYVLDYLKTFDKKQMMAYSAMSVNDNQQRKFKEQVRLAKLIINGGWHNI